MKRPKSLCLGQAKLYIVLLLFKAILPICLHYNWNSFLWKKINEKVLKSPGQGHKC